jgi:hypothetical protein
VASVTADPKENHMGLQPKTTELSIVDQDNIIQSDLGTQNAKTGTLDLTKFEVSAAGGVIPAMTPVVKNEGTGLYEPAIAYTGGAYVQADEADGHVYEPVAYDAGATRAPFALFWIGRLKASRIPVPAGHPGATFAAAKGAKGIVYV